MKELSTFKRINFLKCCDTGSRMTHFGLPRVKSLYCVLPEDGILVTKHVRDASLILVLIKTVHFIGVAHGVLSVHNC
jgi:hypothetical protein